MSEYRYCPWCNGPGILISRERNIGFILWPRTITEYRVVCGNGECCYQPEGQWQSSRENAWYSWNFRPQDIELNKNAEPTHRSLVARILDKTDAQLLAEKAAMSPFGAFKCRVCGYIFPKANPHHGSGGICILCSELSVTHKAPSS